MDGANTEALRPPLDLQEMEALWDLKQRRQGRWEHRGLSLPLSFLCPWLGIVEPKVPITQFSSEVCEANSAGSELVLI